MPLQKFIIVDAGITGDAGPNSQVITANPGSVQTFSKPKGVTQLIIECWGGGGAGGGSSTNNNTGGGGGGGGAYSKRTFTGLPAAATSYNLSVGIGGNTSVTAGSVGGDTWAISNDLNGVVAKGGSGGAVGANPTSTAAGGQASAGFGDIKFNGGTGGAGSGTVSGGGGGAAGSNGIGGNASNNTNGTGTLTGGGDGGAGTSTPVLFTGVSGSAYGGGGSGGYRTTGGTGNNRTGGGGAAGAIVITYYESTTMFLDIDNQ